MLILILLSSCKTLDSLEIGNELPRDLQCDVEKSQYTLLNSATILPLYYWADYISIGGNKGIIEFIKDETPDKDFYGLKIGDKVFSGSDLFGQIQVEIGVGFYIPINDGWNAFIGDSNTDEEDFEIRFFFKKINSGAGIFMSYEEYKTWLERMQ